MFKYFYNRKLRVDILTLFLALILIASSVIVSFFYRKQSKIIQEIAGQMIDQAGNAVGERVNCLVTDLQRVAQFSDVFLTHFDKVSVENKSLIVFMVSVLQTYPDVETFCFATAAGDFLGISRASNGIAYRFNELYQGQHTIYEKDEQLRTVKEEKQKEPFDPRQRPWYQEVQTTKQLHWTEVYQYDSTEERGITVAIPLLDKASEIKAVIGIDVPLATLAEFLDKQKIGKNGKAFIVDDQGKMIVPFESNSLALHAFQKYRHTGQNDLLLEEKGKKYLANIRHLPLSFERHWLIAVIVPRNDFFGHILKEHRDTLLVALAILALASLLVFWFSKLISKPIVDLSHEIDRIKHLDLESEKRVPSHVREIILLDESIASMRTVLRSFSKYVPQDIVRQLLQQGKEIRLGGEKKEVAVLFSDIENFTTITESYPSDVLVPLIGDYFDHLTRVIFEANGTVDKYIGDSVMAFWGAPSDTTKHELRACVTALRCHAALAEFNSKRQLNNEPIFTTRFGVHAGLAIAGNFGTASRMNYTIMGDTVNTAFRLQLANKLYHTAIIISEPVYQQVKDQFLIRPLDIIEVKGKKERIKIYELVAKLQAEKEILPQEWQKDLCARFTQAYNLYESGHTQEAKALFLEINALYPDDIPTQVYLSR